MVSSGQHQDLRVCYLWEYYIKEQQAVARQGLEEEMLSGQDQGRYWITWPKAAGLYTSPNLKSDIANTCRHRDRLSNESICELSLSFGRPQVGTIVSVIPRKR